MANHSSDELGPGVGDVMPELICAGATTTPIEPFNIARFAKQPAEIRQAVTA